MNTTDTSRRQALMERYTRRFFPKIYALRTETFYAVFPGDDDYGSGDDGCSLLAFGEAVYALRREQEEPDDAVACLRGIGNAIDVAHSLQDCRSMRDAFAFYTGTQYAAMYAEKERQELEGIASRFAASLRLSVDDVAFLDALHSAVYREREVREGMREDGLCAGDGTHAGYYEACDGSQDRSWRLRRLQGWMRANTPLLWARWLESLEPDERQELVDY